VVENDVDAAFVGNVPDFVGEDLLTVVDDVIRALLANAIEFAAGRGDDDFGLRCQRAAQLDRRGGDAAANRLR
jgi:hypothetical protein